METGTQQVSLPVVLERKTGSSYEALVSVSWGHSAITPHMSHVGGKREVLQLVQKVEIHLHLRCGRSCYISGLRFREKSRQTPGGATDRKFSRTLQSSCHGAQALLHTF